MSDVLNASEFEEQIRSACKRFYALFDVFPKQIEVSVKRTLVREPFPLHIRFVVPQLAFPMRAHGHPEQYIKTADVDIPVVFGSALDWNDFRLHHRMVANNPQGFLTADDLKMNIKTIQRMIHQKGYEAYALVDDLGVYSSDEKPYDLVSIRRGNQCVDWIIDKDLYKQDFDCIKVELDTQLQKFAQLDQAQQEEQEAAPAQPLAREKQQETFEFDRSTCLEVHVDLNNLHYDTLQRIFEQQYLQYRVNPTYLFASAETYQAIEQSIEDYLNAHHRVHHVKPSDLERLPYRYVAIINQTTGTYVNIVPSPGLEPGRLTFGFVKG